jgi:hypothetical protein
MATINNVEILVGGKLIATAKTGEIAPPPAASLTVSNPRWAPGINGWADYLQKKCRVTATAVGRPFVGNFTIAGIQGAGRYIKLTTAAS